MNTTQLPPWPSGSATGVGSMPGTDARESARVVLGTLPTLPFLPELPERGPGADMIGRTAGLLAELHAELRPSGWRLADRPGRDDRRAAAWLREDLDALEEFAQGYRGTLKIQATGVWTLAAQLELRSGQPALSDPGACRDLAASLAEGLRGHLAETARRVPGARVLLQLDEPSLPAVLAGDVRTASGFGRLRAPEPETAEDVLRTLIDAAAVPVAVHCCAPGVPLALLRRAGAAAVGLDTGLLTDRDEEAVGEAVEAGVGLLAGALPTGAETASAAGAGAPQHGAAAGPRRAGMSDPGGSVVGVRTLWRRLGLDPRTLPASVALTPACGLAGASPRYAQEVLEFAVRAAKSLVDDPEG